MPQSIWATGTSSSFRLAWPILVVDPIRSIRRAWIRPWRARPCASKSLENPPERHDYSLSLTYALGGGDQKKPQDFDFSPGASAPAGEL